MTNYFDSNGCPETFHTFARAGEGEISAYHSDNSECKVAEFDIEDLLNDELPTMYKCPWCDKNTLDIEHMRGCSGYQPEPTIEEIKDAYSHPADQAKRDSLLAEKRIQ